MISPFGNLITQKVFSLTFPFNSKVPSSRIEVLSKNNKPVFVISWILILPLAFLINPVIKNPCCFGVLSLLAENNKSPSRLYLIFVIERS